MSSKPTPRRIERQTERNIKGEGEKSISEMQGGAKMQGGKEKRGVFEKVGGETLGRNQDSKGKNS